MQQDEQRGLQPYYEKVNQMEAHIEIIAVEQSRMATVLERQADSLAKVVDRLSATEHIASAIHERTDQHSKTIERLQEHEIDIGKMLESFKVQLEIIKAIGAIMATLVIGYVFSHFVK